MRSSAANRDRKILMIVAIIVVTLVIIQTINNVINVFEANKDSQVMETDSVVRVSAPKGIGSASYGGDTGTASMCINTPPIITNDCNLTDAVINISQEHISSCQFEAIDPNGDQMTFDSMWGTSPELFNISSDGKANLTFRRANMQQVNVFRISVTDDSLCSNNDMHKDYQVRVVGDNRPPYLIKNIPNQKVVKDHYFLFYLNDYFADPDEDPLYYFPILQSGNTVKTTITGNKVEIKGVGCGISTVYYIAMDPLGLTAQSNYVQYDVQCPESSTQATGNNNKDTGAGGSGKGGNAETCFPNWKCSSWAPCKPENYTSRKCVDYNACNPYNYQHYAFANCTYVFNTGCTENWECNEWSRCIDNIHTRLCMDTRNCGTNSSKPSEMENCSTIPSCFNGIKDQDETEVDCGGSCGACRRIEQPAKISRWNTATIAALVLSVSITGMLIFAFRKKIIAAYKRIGVKKRLKRKIYISNKQKEKLQQIINVMQARMDEHKRNHVINESASFIKEYFRQLLSIDNLDKQELIRQITKLKDKDLEKLLVMFYAKIVNITNLNNKGAEITEEETQALIDEISHNLYLIAEFTDQDAINSQKDRSTKNKGLLESIYNKISNLYIALKFGELIAAKNLYRETLKDYEKLSDKDKSIPYADIIRAFHTIDYLEKESQKTA